MMEIEAASTPRGTTPTQNCFSANLQLRQQPFQQPNQLSISSSNILPRSLKSTLRENGVVITPHSAPQSEYEVSSSASLGNGYNQTTSKLPTLNRNSLTKSISNPTPSPDSAIHSVYYSPSQSPVDLQSSIHSQQSRIQVSGLSSPFSSRTTPASSLSRTNSDASQYGSASMTSLPTSVSATSVSPISPSQQYSPTNSPNQTRHPSGGSGSHSLQSQHQIIQGNTVLIKSHNNPPLLPSTPLPQSIANRAQNLSFPPSLHGIIMQRNEDNNRSAMTSVTKMSEFMDSSGQEYMDDKTSGLSAQPGISRQQLINR